QQRRREIGIRLALGANRGSVVWLIARQGMIWTGAGLMLGTIAGLAVALLLRSWLHGVTADPLAFVLTPFVLGGASYAACYLPARRAARLDPLAALRED